MKKWLKFFGISFFSHKTAKEAIRRGYTNVFLAFVLTLALIWVGYIGGDMLPFGTHYGNSPDFMVSVRAVFANPDINKRIEAKVKDGDLKLGKHGVGYVDVLLINTFENEADKRDYSFNGYNIVVDSRPADTLAEIEAYCISNDGKNTVISYEDYLTLSEVARLNFDFKLRYTGKELELTDEAVDGYKEYVDGINEENKATTARLMSDLSDNKITRSEYNREIYELYFTNFYPEITEYESTSRVPLLRNYYYHKYISNGAEKYLFIFDDYMAGHFETKNGIDVSFYGFYSSLDNGYLVYEGATQDQANTLADGFIKDSFASIGTLNAYIYFMNVLAFVPFIALMLMVVTLLAYSLIKLRGAESIRSFGAMFKVVGSFVWFSGVVSAVFTVILSFFVGRNILNALPLMVFFACLTIRSIIFSLKESSLYAKQLEQHKAEQTEV